MSEYHYQQKRRADLERRKREAERRRVEQEITRLSKLCAREYTAAQKLLHEQESGNLKDYLSADDITSFYGDLNTINNSLQQAVTPQSLKMVRWDLKLLRKRIKSETAAAGKRKKIELQRLAKLEKELAAALIEQHNSIIKLQQEEVGAYITNELMIFQQEINRLQTFLNDQQLDQVLSGLTRLSSEVSEAEEAGYFRYELVQKTTELLTEIRDQLADPVNKTWVGRELADLENRTNTLLLQYSKGEFQITDDLEDGGPLAILEEQRDELLLDARERQQDEDERKKAVGIFIAALKTDGFSVANPRLEGDQRGAVLITATRPGRSRKQEVALKIDLGGNVEMDVDGGDPGDVRRVQEARLDKKKESQAACRQVASKILEFVAKEGMELEEVKRSWHNPDRIEKGAKDLPAGKDNRAKR